jgi:hypothetical protein
MRNLLIESTKKNHVTTTTIENNRNMHDIYCNKMSKNMCENTIIEESREMRQNELKCV